MKSVALLSQHDGSEVTEFDGKQHIRVCFSEEARELLQSALKAFYTPDAIIICVKLLIGCDYFHAQF